MLTVNYDTSLQLLTVSIKSNLADLIILKFSKSSITMLILNKDDLAFVP